MAFFKYGQKELDYLKSRDKKLATIIDKTGIIKREVTPDPFPALLWSIINQQISMKAAQTVYGRFTKLTDSLTPEKINKIDLNLIQQCGMSLRKAGYIKGIAQAAVNGDVDFRTLYTLSDEEIIKKLSSLNGVGTWTAEMLLIFSLCRPDVVSWGDFGIRNGMMILYGKESLNKKQFDLYRKRYSPYGSIASFYLWKCNENASVEP